MKELSFKTNARHIGQLGRELVTDFVTALVELIKNAYDADADGAKIIISDTKKASGQIIIADCGDGMTIEDFENKWMVIGTSNKLSDPYTPRGRKKAGKKGIGRFSVERLAERVTIYSFPENEIPFCVKIDWNKFEELDIPAIKQRIEILRHRKDREAAKFIASQLQYVMLLPNIVPEDAASIQEFLHNDYANYRIYFEQSTLSLIETEILPLLQKYEGHRQLIEEIKSPLVPINDFRNCKEYQIIEQIGKEASKRSAKNPEKESYSGLVMVLDGLRDEWSQKDIDKLEKELRLLVAPDFLETDPFYIGLEAPEFKVEESVPVNSIIDASYAKLSARITESGKKGDIHYTDRKGVERKREFDFSVPLLCGDLTFELFYFLRDSEHLQLDGHKYRYITRILDAYCGIKIYRDMFRVKPYGDPGNDWLFLDKEKVRDTHGYLVGNNQTIGRINISDEKNPLLIDATNREGIIENTAFEQLRSFIQECLALIAEVRKEAYEEKVAAKKELEAQHKIIEAKKKEIVRKHDEVSQLIQKIGAATISNSEPMVREFVAKIQQYHQQQQEYQREYESNAEKRYRLVQDVLDLRESELAMYKNLATLGMLASEFGHETSDIINRLQNSVQAVIRDIRTVPELDVSLEILNIVKDDFRRISSYSEMIIAFLRKKKRENVEPLIVANVVEEICGYYENILAEFHIDLKHSCDEHITLTMRQIDLESIIINMITNAYAQLKTCKDRKIFIRVWKEHDTIRMRFHDTGPGVPENERERIFTAFVSSKDDGVGLGLNIVRDIVTSYNGTVKCESSTLLGGACFAIDFIIGDGTDAAERNLH